MFWQFIILLILLIPLLAIVLDSQVGRALADRLEARRIPPGDDAGADRIAVLESEVERLQSEVARLSEESDFLHKLLSDRTSASEEAPEGPRPAELPPRPPGHEPTS